METEELVDRLMAEIYHAPIQHPDSVVQERIVKSNAANLIEEFADDLRDELEASMEDLAGPRCEDTEEELTDLRRRVAELEADLA